MNPREVRVRAGRWTQAAAIRADALLGLALRIGRLPHIAAWSDEYQSLRVSALPLREVLTGNEVQFISEKIEAAQGVRLPAKKAGCMAEKCQLSPLRQAP